MKSGFVRTLTLWGALVTLCLLITASAGAIHPRPKGATPLRVPLVPSYAHCTAPNRTHGPPLAFGSCNPPAQTSTQATVGTPDAFGGAATSNSFLRLTPYLALPGGPEEGDIRIDLVLNDVRCVPTGAHCGTANLSGPADYSGEMGLLFAFRVTDHWNATAPGGGPDAATVQDFAIDLSGWEFSWTCAQSASTSMGSTCNMTTTRNAIHPGAWNPGKREVWELQAVRIYDGGADGDGNTTADNTLFARPGVFIP